MTLPEFHHQNNSVIYDFPDSLDSLDFDLDQDNGFHDRPASDWSITKIGTLEAKIERYLAAKKRTYFANKSPDEVPMHHLIGLVNQTFGFDGWSTEVVDICVLRESSESDLEGKDKYSLETKAKVRLILKDGTSQIAEGFGRADNLPSKSMAYTKAKKEAITEANKHVIQNLKYMLIKHENNLRTGYYGNK